MAKNKNRFLQTHSGYQKTPVDSLLDVMKDGREYESLIDVVPRNLNARDEIRRAISNIESIRKHPLIIYTANVTKSIAGTSIDINYSDDLPFSEMVSSVPQSDSLDILIVTPGGLAQQVNQFVNKVRPRFPNVSMILPYMAMSAGTIWALSGNDIWMDQRAFIGPIDPQVPGKDGRFIPAQALLALLKKIQEDGQENIKKGQNPNWSDILILQNMDSKEIGNAISLSKYSIQLATEYLTKYKFRDWTDHSSNGKIVTDTDRADRAAEVASKLCSHEVWKVHSHGISRETAWQEIKIKIEHPESVPGLERAIRRLWALLYYFFESSLLSKIFISDNYALFKATPPPSQNT